MGIKDMSLKAIHYVTGEPVRPEQGRISSEAYIPRIQWQGEENWLRNGLERTIYPILQPAETAHKGNLLSSILHFV
jgi:hypothetical protein